MPPFVGMNRDFLNWEWFCDRKALQVLVYLLLNTSDCEKQWCGLQVGVGDVVTTIGQIARDCNLSPKEVRNAITKIQNSGLGASRTTNKNTIVTIENKGFFAIVKEKGASKRANEGQTKGEQKANKTHEEEPDGKPQKRNKVSARPSEDYTPEFETFWAQYPRHTAKKNAFKAWRSVNPKDINPTQKEQEAILHDIAVRLGRGEWQEEQYIPHASTYLNGRRWEDEAKPTYPAEAGKGYYNPFIQMALEAEERERNEGI